MLPVFEKENGLLYYPTFYEGLEQSKNVIYTGQESSPADHLGPRLGRQAEERQELLPDWLRLYLAADFHPRSRASALKTSSSSRSWARSYPLGRTNFNSLINKIKVAKPDCIYAIVVGGSNVAFYKQLKAAGIT